MRPGVIEAILFDKDGTLTDFRRTWDGWLGRTLRHLGRESGAEPAALAGALGYDLAAGRMAPGGLFSTASSNESACALAAVIGWPADRVAAWWSEAARHVAQVPVGDAPRLLDRLRARGLRLGVLTNDERAAALRHLGHLGVLDRLDGIVAADDGHGPKPAPDGALAFARAVGVPPGAVLVVGDGFTDRDAARGAGMRFAAVLTGTQAAEAFAGADAVLADIEALPAWLDGAAGAAV